MLQVRMFDVCFSGIFCEMRGAAKLDECQPELLEIWEVRGHCSTAGAMCYRSATEQREHKSDRSHVLLR